jgi:hypothetical protein
MTENTSMDHRSADGMVDIAAQLEQDDSGSTALGMIAQFEADAVPLEDALRGALPPDEYEVTEKMVRALRTAQDVIRKVWGDFHPGKELMPRSSQIIDWSVLHERSHTGS